MGLRHFRDSEGAEWRVWDVVPYGGRPQERRMADRRSATGATYTGPERRSGRDRRLRTPALMTPGLESGWLCFENEAEKRRLSPIPRGWDRVEPSELAGLLGRAAAVARRFGL
jgi:hypothetical protein